MNGERPVGRHLFSDRDTDYRGATVVFLECKVESACEAGKVKPYDVCGYGDHIMGSHIWGSQRCVGEKISLREKCTQHGCHFPTTIK